MTMTADSIQTRPTADTPPAIATTDGHDLPLALSSGSTAADNCPPWCSHPHDWPEDEGIHTSRYYPPARHRHPEVPLQARLERGFPGQGRRTYVGLVHDAEYYELTLAEAAVLAGQILALVFTAVTSPRGRRAF